MSKLELVAGDSLLHCVLSSEMATLFLVILENVATILVDDAGCKLRDCSELTCVG